MDELLSQRLLKTAQLKEIVDRAEAEKRVMDAAELAAFDRLKNELENIDRQIESLKQSADRKKALREIEERYAQGGRRTNPDPLPPDDANRTRLEAYRQMRRFRQVVNAYGPGEDGNQRAYRCGMWARAVFFGDQAAKQWCIDYGGASIQNAMGTNSNTDGGVFVPEEMSQAIIDLRETFGVFRRNTRVIPMARDTIMVPRRLSGVTVYYVTENMSSAPTESNPKFNGIKLTVKELMGIAKLSRNIRADAVIDLGNMIAEEFAYAFAVAEDAAGFTGDGTSTYGGIKGLTTWFSTTGGPTGGQLVGAVDAAAGHDTFEEIDASDLAKVIGRLPEYVQNPVWLCSKLCAEVVFGRLCAIAGGNNTETLSNGEVGRQYLGYPIVVSQKLPKVLTDLSDKAMLFFGDLALAATLGDRGDLEVFPSDHRYMDTNQIGIRGTQRYDINVHDVGDETTGDAGPIVALVGE